MISMNCFLQVWKVYKESFCSHAVLIKVRNTLEKIKEEKEMEIEIQNIIKIVKDAAGILSQRDLIGDILCESSG